MRNEFDEAKAALNELIAHTRNFDLFDPCTARIALHYGHLAHALGDFVRAAQCYAIVVQMAAEGTCARRSVRESSRATYCCW